MRDPSAPILKPSVLPMQHQVYANELDVMCTCGWYNHGTGDRSATAHILRTVMDEPHLADEYEADYRNRWTP